MSPMTNRLSTISSPAAASGCRWSAVVAVEQPARPAARTPHRLGAYRVLRHPIVDQPDLAILAADAGELAQRRQLLGVVEHAKDEGRYHGIEVPVGKGSSAQIVDAKADRAPGPLGARRGPLEHLAAHIDRMHVGTGRVERQVRPGSGAGVENSAGKAGKDHPTQRPTPAIFVGGVDQVGNNFSVYYNVIHIAK